MIAAIERGYPQREIAEAAYQYQRAIETGEKIIVGVNAFSGEQQTPEVLSVDSTVRERQSEKLRSLRARRNAARVDAAMTALESAARDSENLMPAILDCVRAYCTVGEICNRLRALFGVYQETSVL